MELLHFENFAVEKNTMSVSFLVPGMIGFGLSVSKSHRSLTSFMRMRTAGSPVVRERH